MDTLLLIVIGIVSRLAPHPANVTAVGGLALFSGAKFSFKKSLLIVFLTMMSTDVILGFHQTMWATYGSLYFAIVLGKLLQTRKSVGWIVGFTFFSSVIFYLMTNFAVWVIPHSMYPKTFAGLIDCYIMALPFFRNSLIGDFFYSAVFFGGYRFIGGMLKRHQASLYKVIHI